MKSRVYRSISERLDRYHQSQISNEICDLDDMLDLDNSGAVESYLRAGSSAIEVIATAMLLNSMEDISKVLDLPCGFGRVTRHLKVLLPESEIFVTDLQVAGVKFCADTFGATPLVATENFDTFDLDQQFDLIWSGSLLTHFDQKRFIAAIKFFERALSPGGIAALTFHGRFSPFSHRNRWEYLPNKLFAKAEKSFKKKGFGYVDYPGQSGYGISLSTPSFTLSRVEALTNSRIIGYHERAWDGHQDVLIIAKKGIFD